MTERFRTDRPVPDPRHRFPRLRLRLRRRQTGGRRRGVLVAGAGLATLGVVLGGCGIPTQSAARPIPAKNVPFNLISRQPSATTSTSSPSFATTVTVYFTFTGDRVAPVSRQVQKATITSILGALLGGPNQEQTREGYQTALSTVRVIRASLGQNGVATVDLTSHFGQLSGSQPLLAVAQIVFTLTSNLHTITGVEFQTEDFPTPVPTPTGALTGAPVGPAQYQTLLAPSTTTTTAPAG